MYTSPPYNVENSEVFRMVYEEVVFGSSTGFGVLSVICGGWWPQRRGDPVLGSVRSACR